MTTCQGKFVLIYDVVLTIKDCRGIPDCVFYSSSECVSGDGGKSEEFEPRALAVPPPSPPVNVRQEIHATAVRIGNPISSKPPRKSRRQSRSAHDEPFSLKLAYFRKSNPPPRPPPSRNVLMLITVIINDIRFIINLTLPKILENDFCWDTNFNSINRLRNHQV